VPADEEDSDNNESDGRRRTTKMATRSQLDAKLSGNHKNVFKNQGDWRLFFFSDTCL
jgi:hypothetical protein